MPISRHRQQSNSISGYRRARLHQLHALKQRNEDTIKGEAIRELVRLFREGRATWKQVQFMLSKTYPQSGRIQIGAMTKAMRSRMARRIPREKWIGTL